MAKIQAEWGFPKPGDTGELHYARPATCSECDNNTFYIVTIEDLVQSNVPLAMCTECGTLFPILPPSGS